MGSFTGRAFWKGVKKRQSKGAKTLLMIFIQAPRRDGHIDDRLTPLTPLKNHTRSDQSRDFSNEPANTQKSE
jgi:hypothetical protein